MRTKTPKQICEQLDRIYNHPRTKTNITRCHKAYLSTLRYWDNIYKANGIADRLSCNDTAKCNEIWNTAAVPASVYAKQV